MPPAIHIKFDAARTGITELRFYVAFRRCLHHIVSADILIILSSLMIIGRTQPPAVGDGHHYLGC